MTAMAKLQFCANFCRGHTHHSEPYCTLWDHFGTYGTIWSHIWPHRKMGDHEGPYIIWKEGEAMSKFALKCEKHSKFKKWFKPTEKNLSTRNKPSKYTKAFTMTKRFEKSPLPYLTDLLNLYYRKKWKLSNCKLWQWIIGVCGNGPYDIVCTCLTHIQYTLSLDK